MIYLFLSKGVDFALQNKLKLNLIKIWKLKTKTERGHPWTIRTGLIDTKLLASYAGHVDWENVMGKHGIRHIFCQTSKLQPTSSKHYTLTVE